MSTDAPVVVATETTTGTAVTTLPVVIPDSDPAAGDTILVVISTDDQTITAPSGSWAEVKEYQDTGFQKLGAYRLTAAGTEGGTTVNFTSGVATPYVATAMHIRGSAAAVGAIEVTAGTEGDSTTITFDKSTPRWDNLDTLWVACAGWVDDDEPLLTWPEAYYHTRDHDVSGGGEDAGTALAVATRRGRFLSDTPGSITIDEGVTGPAQQVAVDSINSSTGVDAQTVTNPVQSTGNTLIAISVATGPSNEATSGSAYWVAPTNGSPSQIFDYAGSGFVSRVRAWQLTDDGSANYTFGWETNAGNSCTCVLVGLDDLVTDVDVTATPNTDAGTSCSFPTLTTTADYLALAIGSNQSSGKTVTTDPTGYTEELNQSPGLRSVCIWSDTTAASETPSNVTRDVSGGAFVTWVLGLDNGFVSGGTPPDEPLGVVATESAYSTTANVTVTNPDPNGSGTLVFISNCQGFGNAGTITWTSPDAGATVQDTLTNTTGEFWSQCRIWTFTNDGSTNFTFGGSSGSDNRQSGVIVALDGAATAIRKSGSFTATGSVTSVPYPQVSSTAVDDLVLAIALQQTTDQLTAGPSGYTEEHNDTASTPNRIAVHSKVEDVAGSETPGNATWGSSTGARVTYTMAFAGAGEGSPGGGGPTAARISTNDLVIDLDASNTSTWGKNRTKGQWVIGGDVFNPGANGTTHGLVWEADNTTINSFAMQDSQGTARLRANTYAGIDIIDGATQFVDDGSYVYQAGQVNTALNSPPSDELFHDGSRVHISFQGASELVSVGSAANPLIVGVSFVVEQWMFADDWTSGPFSLHSPTIYHSGPIALRLRNGAIHLLGRYSATAIDPDSTSNVSGSWSGGSQALTAVGSWFTVIVEFVIDPGATGYYKWWYLNNTTGELALISQGGPNFGWLFDTGDPGYDGHNDEFYVVHQIYNWHNAVPPPALNWDSAGAGSNVRRFRFPYAAVAQAATIDKDDMGGHAKYFLGIT